MKYYIFMCMCMFCLAGCANRSVITDYSSDGTIMRTVETSESVLSKVMESTRGKSVLIWEDGWSAYASVSTGTTEDPTPHGKLYLGKVNRGWFSLQPGVDLSGIDSIIRSTRSEVTVTLDGISGQK